MMGLSGAWALVTRTVPSFEAAQSICPASAIINIPKPTGRTPQATIRCANSNEVK
jgi:hypothetical protein